MPRKRAELESQLKQAKEHVEIRANQPKEKDISGDAYKTKIPNAAFTFTMRAVPKLVRD